MKPLAWVGSAYGDFRDFPEPVQADMGYALYLAQVGQTAPSAKPLKGYGGAGILEVVESHDGNTYRTVYTVRFEHVVYVLHSFQKKAKHGRATPKKELEMVERRLSQARRDYETWQRGTT